MMVEAARVTGLGLDGQRIDRTDAWNVAQQLVVDVVGKPRMCQPLDLVALVDEAAALRDDHAEHGDGRRALRHRQCC